MIENEIRETTNKEETMSKQTKRKILGGQFEIVSARFFIGSKDECTIRTLYDRRFYDQMRKDGIRGFGIEPFYIGEFKTNEEAELAAQKILADEAQKKAIRSEAR